MTGFAVVGSGRVGAALACLWVQSGMTFLGFLGRDRARTRAALRLVGSGRALAGPAALSAAELVLVAVPDGALAEVARAAASAGGVRRGSLWIHASGARSAAVLAPIEAAGGRIGSIHPLCPVPTAAEGVRSIPGCTCAVEGAAKVVNALRRLVLALGCKPLRISGARKPLYHVAAVMASNYLIALLATAAEVLARATAAAGTVTAQARKKPAQRGRNESLAALLPLAQATLVQVARLGFEAALTGPLARGDRQLVSLQRAALRASGIPGADRVYGALGTAALRILERSAGLPEDDLRALRSLLRDARPRGSGSRRRG